jgi:hypothetical protein
MFTERNKLAKIRSSLAHKKGPSEFLHNELFIYKTNKCTSDIQSNSVKTSRRGAEYFVLLYTNVVITDKHNVTVNSQELIGTTECLT